MPEVFLNYIAGQWVECKSKKTFPNVNPARTDETVGLFQASGAEDVQAAWAVLPAPRRTVTPPSGTSSEEHTSTEDKFTGIEEIEGEYVLPKQEAWNSQIYSVRIPQRTPRGYFPS